MIKKNKGDVKDLKNEIDQNEDDIEERKNKIKRDIRVLILLLIMLLLVLLFTIGMGFTLLHIYKNSKYAPVEVVKSEILEVKYTESDFFNITDDRVLLDENGLKTKPLKFNLTNTGTSDLSYKIKLVSLNKNIKAEEKIPDSAIRYKIVEQEKNIGIKTFSEAKEDALHSGKIKAKESIDYSLYIWLDYNSNINLYNKSYLFKIQIEAGK